MTSPFLGQVLPGVTFFDVLMRGWTAGDESHLQIGRSPPLSPDKSKTHFPILQSKTGIPFAEMLFFDDSVRMNTATIRFFTLPLKKIP